MARCLTVHDHHSIIDCHVKFQNVTSLIISNKYIDNDHWSTGDINRIMPLEKLTKLVVECDLLCINVLFKIFNSAKNIHSLVLAPYDISDAQFLNIKQVDNDYALINQNNVVQLTIRSTCNPEQVQCLINIFPRVKHLQLKIYYVHYQSIMKFLLLENRKNNSHLFSLSLTIIGKIPVTMEDVKPFIDDQKLLDNYSITISDIVVHLWW